MKRMAQFLVLACLLTLTVQSMAVAQESGTIQAIATVVSGLRVTGMNNLDFGTVLPGIDKSVDKTDVGFAGEWEVTGQFMAELNVDFILPGDLYTADSNAAMMIDFSATDVSYDDGTGGGQVAPLGIVNPNGPNVMNLGSSGILSIWIGGTVRPTISQTGGDYSADVTLIVAYTGS